MAGPLAGIGTAQQQIPLSNPSQPSQSQQAIRPEEREPEENRVQPQGASVSGTQDSGVEDQNTLQARAQEVLSASNNNESNTPRGSVVDISI